MTDSSLFRLRVEFGKQGRLALLSHLEVARALERAVRRANLPFAVSKGFSPHMRIAFGAALPVGVGGTSEIFDILLLRYVRPSDALQALQHASVPDLMCTSCAYIEPTAKAASVAYPFSTYVARFTEAPVRLEVPAEITVVRKKKEKVLRSEEFLVGPMLLDGDTVRFTLQAKDTGSLRPDVLLRACCEHTMANGASSAEPDVDSSITTTPSPLRVASITRVRQSATAEEALR
ncbi:TIGR03936 family radical SAM-associated protein [Adlercreutzia sp. ZJ141]|uniref:TIGR03936 family radical SAM-associated protein n=1 Tax=Adlercreutzia sp. ZJ141 TaxID=2709406 RepID=UPI0013EC3761|nr:TIGR03936 family radical SAM-associated protein [Adlercreutzia sp. ZJ141]